MFRKRKFAQAAVINRVLSKKKLPLTIGTSQLTAAPNFRKDLKEKITSGVNRLGFAALPFHLAEKNCIMLACFAVALA